LPLKAFDEGRKKTDTGGGRASTSKRKGRKNRKHRFENALLEGRDRGGRGRMLTVCQKTAAGKNSFKKCSLGREKRQGVAAMFVSKVLSTTKR